MDQYKSILANIATKSDAEEVSSCIDAILESFYKTKKSDYKKIIDKSLNADLAEALKSLLPFSSSDGGSPELDSGHDSSEVEALDDFLTNLKNKIQKLKVIKLTIAFSPTIDCIKTISSFVKEKFGEEFILEIEQDPKILAGAIIALNGKYQDLSLKKQLDEIFEKKKVEIVKLIQ